MQVSQEEISKIKLLSKITEHEAYLFHLPPTDVRIMVEPSVVEDVPGYYYYYFGHCIEETSEEYLSIHRGAEPCCDFESWWYECPVCHAVKLFNCMTFECHNDLPPHDEEEGRLRWKHQFPPPSYQYLRQSRIYEAILASRSARFEWGQRGAQGDDLQRIIPRYLPTSLGRRRH